MKISIGPITFEIRFPKFSSNKIDPTPWAQHVWNMGMDTCERVYGSLTDKVGSISIIEERDQTQERINLAIEELLPSPRNHQELALQGLIRRSLTVDPSKHSQKCSLLEQYSRVALVAPLPYKLPHPYHIPLEPMLCSMAKFGRSLLHPNSQGPLVTVPFIDYLKAEKVLVYSETLAEKLYDEFMEQEMPGLRGCKQVDNLLYCVLGLYQLYFIPKSLKGEISKAASKQKKQIKSSINLLSELLDELGELTVPDSGGLTHVETLRYQRYATSKFREISGARIEHHSRKDSLLAHTLTLDPLENRFFVHLKKKGFLNKSVHKDDTCTVHHALMVEREKLTLVYDVVKKKEGNPNLAMKLMIFLKHCPYIIDPPIAISQYEKVAHFRYSYMKHLGTLLEKQTKTSEIHETVCLLQDYAKGIHEIHKTGYLHGNIKPASLLIKQGSERLHGVIGSLEMAAKVDDNNKQPYIQVIGKDGKLKFHPDGRPKMRRSDYQGDKRYIPPEYLLNSNEALSQKSDIWSFAIVAWQYLYGKNSDDFPFPLNHNTLYPEFEKETFNEQLENSFPEPRTVQENSLQLLIKHCLTADPSKRMNSSELVMEIECVRRRPPVTYTHFDPPPPSLKDLFEPFQKFEAEGMGTRPGGPIIRTLRKTKSYLQLPGNSVGHRSLPPELFEIFCEQGNLNLHIEEFEKRIDQLSKKHSHSMEKLEEAEEGLQKTFRVIEKLTRIFDRFNPQHADILENQRDSLSDSCEKLHSLTTQLLNFPVDDAAGLTYKQVKQYRVILKQKAKIYKKPLGFLDEAELNQPISFHFDKGSEEGLEHPVTYDPINKTLIVHIKKRGFRKKELGKGAVKSVHEGIKLKNNTISQTADVVIRLDSFDIVEERLKHLFSDCPYIEDPAEAITVYDKDEIPSMWKNKKNMEAPEIVEIEKTATKTTVKKLAFFPPLYFSSLGGVSYRKGKERDTSLIISLFGHIATGLAVMHERGYIHRDIKPGNVLIKKISVGDKSQFIGVLADLGEAVYVGLSGTLANNQPMAGTKHYNSPEVCYPSDHEKYKNQSFASDVWAFGITMCQALYGNSGRDIPFLDSTSKIHIFTQLKELTQDDIYNTLENLFPENCSNAQKTVNALIKDCLIIEPDLRPTAKTLAEKLM